MKLSLLNYLFAFFEGFALIISPCILPILPIMLSGGITGGRRRPFGIICGFVLVFALFTFASRILVQYVGIDLDLVRKLAFGLIALFGLVLISDYLSAKFSLLTAKVGNLGLNLSAKQDQKPGGFMSGLLLGAFTSLIWVPCGGPILAAAIVQSAIQKTYFESFLIFFFFALGSVIPMILIALLGRTIMNRFQFLKTKSEGIRKIFGVIIIVGAAAAAFIGPEMAGGAPMSSAPNVASKTNSSAESTALIGGLSTPYPAPALNDPDNAWINSPPLKLSQLKGKVVLIDFWTYSCINCVRTLPYLKDWYAKYHQNGFVIIGVHSPEFEFEKNFNNVKNAVVKYGILYPVVLDNNYGTWLNYDNQYWPAHYLIDKNGNVVYQHFGEGNYDETEHNIRVLLGLNGNVTSDSAVVASSPVFTRGQTPETYLGYARASSFNSVEAMQNDQTQNYTFPQNLPQDAWALEGNWSVHQQYIQAMGRNSSIEIHFNAAKVYIVAGTSDGNSLTAKVLLNGKVKSSVAIKAQALYPVLDLPKVSNGILILKFNQPGVQLYTFTFGS